MWCFEDFLIKILKAVKRMSNIDSLNIKYTSHMLLNLIISWGNFDCVCVIIYLF